MEEDAVIVVEYGLTDACIMGRLMTFLVPGVSVAVILFVVEENSMYGRNNEKGFMMADSLLVLGLLFTVWLLDVTYTG